MPKRILLLMLDFCTWEQARPWSYTANFGIENGLLANGAQCLTVPVLQGVPTNSRHSWIAHLPKLLSGQKFDQVWVWLVHTQFDDPFWSWLKELAPVRVGYVMEGLTYDPKVAAVYRPFAERKAYVESQMQHFTHVLISDEADLTDLNRSGQPRPLLWQSCIPEQFIYKSTSPFTDKPAAFYGVPYDDRAKWLQSDELKGKLVKPPPPENALGLNKKFDQINHSMISFLDHALPTDLFYLNRHTEMLRDNREHVFSAWLESLRNWSSIVSLPSLLKAYPGRVTEPMAAGAPVIAWAIPERERASRLFEAGKEILLFRGDSEKELAQMIDLLRTDSKVREDLAANALSRIRNHFSAKKVMSQVLNWIDGGPAPIWESEFHATRRGTSEDEASIRP